MTGSTGTEQVIRLADAAPDRKDHAQFCSRCGAPAPERAPIGAQPDSGRVCPSCGLGLVLFCPAEARPAKGAPFLVVKDDLKISAVSEAAERIFGTEDSLVGTLLLSSMSSAVGDETLARTVAAAARGMREVSTLPIYAAAATARRGAGLEARVASCWPPRGALVLVDTVLTAAR